MISGEIRIGLIDGDESIREGRKLLLNVPSQLTVVFEADRADLALQYIESYLVDIIIIDQRVRGMTGVELCARIAELRLQGTTSAHLLMTAPFANQALRLQALRAGAQELISQEQGRHELEATIRKLVAGDVCVDVEAIKNLRGAFEPSYDSRLISAIDELSPRERQYVKAVVGGEPIVNVAARYEVASYRVRKPIEGLLKSLGLVTLEQLQLRFLEAGLLDEASAD